MTEDRDIILDDSELFISPISEVCFYCEHLVDTFERKCKAFDDIPLEIWNGDHKHLESYPGDNGIRFKMRED